VLSTVRTDPQWQARVNQVMGNVAAAETKGAMEAWSQYMRGVETYRNPTTGETMELDNKYGNAWAGPNGQYILSDQAGFDPGTLNIGNWTRMEQVRR
jgi:hypothetical protein